MLREMKRTRQVPGEPRRRWFSSPECDLFVWYDEGEHAVGFQICYDKGTREKALTWKSPSRYDHTAVDDGEARPGRYKASPILVADGVFDAARVSALFAAQAERLPHDIVELVSSRLRGYPR